MTRCATPRNVDDDYPDYSGYDSDSITATGGVTGGDFHTKDEGRFAVLRAVETALAN